MAESNPSRAVKLFGTTTLDPEPQKLKAGALSAELDNGMLRYIRIGDVEVLRGIAFLVRDENWGTFAPKIENLKVEESADRFSVTYDATCADAKRSIRYRATIAGSADGKLSFSAEATPETDVLTNRTGFVVLHPLAGVAGRPLTIAHVDGKVVTSEFPPIIDPDCPFRDIRALTHETLPGVMAEVTMTGDTFEMEDHRNWTDASFKTYVRPLALPWPYTLPKGKSFQQAVTLELKGPLPKPALGGGSEPVAVTLGAPSGKMPEIGTGVAAREAAHAVAAADLVKAVGLRHLVCQIDGRQADFAEALPHYRDLGAKADSVIELEIVIPGTGTPSDELATIAEAVRKSGITPSAVAVSPAVDLKAVLPGSPRPPAPPDAEIYAAARAAFPGIRLGGGMFSYFTELNRKPPLAEALDFVTHTTCPIVHAADDVSVMETLEALPYVITSTKVLAKGKPYRLGPSGIAARDNPYGKATSPNPGNGRVCLADMDPRQRGIFGAAWTLGYASIFANGGLEALALCSPTGPSGLIYRKLADAQPYFDSAGSGTVYPVYHIIAALAAASGRTRLDARSSHPSKVTALAFESNGHRHLWLANLTSAETNVTIAGLGGSTTLALLDEAAFVDATRNPDWLGKAGTRLASAGNVTLPPYATARIISD
ncbi:MAG: hypothetical protein R3D57_17080 [Hyphomicrobiaceae bacterium]